MQVQYEKFKAILGEMFQMDQADLDFGIYRIMNAKRGEIEKFLDKDLLPQVDAEIKKATVVEDKAALTNEVFSHLAAFFRRYYDNGDFLSLRRYKKDTYAIPYEGEEVKLHWANADQYYIKTSEYLKDYSFRLPDNKRVHFKLVDASQEKDNIKPEAEKERRFRLFEERPVCIEGYELIIQFVYLPDKEKQEKHNQKTLETVRHEFEMRLADLRPFFDLIKDGLAKTEKNPKRNLLEKHLAEYTARFNYDFFIHKDLGGFLTRELDFYIKNEVIYVDDLDDQDEKKLQGAVVKAKAVKHVARKIITFLTQLENFQKKLWLKKKFVVSCDYCVTLDRVPEALYPEIVANDAQREEWVGLFAIDKIEASTTGPGYSNPLSVEFLKANPFLVLDTKFFGNAFKDKLLSSFEDLDGSCDGQIINSENFQALNLLLEKYRGSVKCVYIDPPYNAQSSEILYKNTYKHSAWLSLIQDRVLCSRSILSDCFVYIIAIDEVENVRLGLMLPNIFTACEDVVVSIVHNPTGQQGNNFSFTHEFAHFVFPAGVNCIGLEDRDDPLRESEPDIRPLRNVSSGVNHLRTSAANCFYPIFVRAGKIVGFGDVCPADFHPGAININREDGIVEIYPIDPSNVESKWVFARDTVESIYDELSAEFDEKKKTWDILRKKSKFRYKSLWEDKRYNANSWGSVVLNNMILENKFTYPKSIFTVRDCVDAGMNNSKEGLVLDFFAGSGTTAHAIINLNREDFGKRKYILIEMGRYFDTVLKPRIQKAVYSKEWRDGKPVLRDGESHMFKYLCLESYDDTLDNLAVQRSSVQQQTIEGMGTRAFEEYFLSYLLDIEAAKSDSLLNIAHFMNPFDYGLKIRKDDELNEQKIDLMETFDYLIGLYVQRIQVINDFRVRIGRLRTGEKTLVIWRNTNDKSNEALDAFFKTQEYGKNGFDLVFVNGDNNLENLKADGESWSVRLIEEEFKTRMFEGVEA